MRWFVKLEKFSEETKRLPKQLRQQYIQLHCEWVQQLKKSGINVQSGYLVDKEGKPGGGGVLIVEAISYESAKSIIDKDPLIIEGLVQWELQEWIPITEEK